MSRAIRALLISILAVPAAFASHIEHVAGQAVFRVETEAAVGAGFLVDDRGMVVTADSLVADARYIAVQIGPEEKYPAAVMRRDPDSGIAVLRVHPQSIAGRPVLSPAADDATEVPVVSGHPVMLIHDPTTGAVTFHGGFVRRVEDRTLTTTALASREDLGGPLLDAQGDVVGVVTIVEDRDGGAAESTAARAATIASVVADIPDSLHASAPPPHHMLPCAPSRPYPAEAMRAATTPWPQPAKYVLEAGKFDVRFVTAALAESLDSYGSDPLAWTLLRRWRAYAGRQEPVVLVFAEPEPRRARGAGSSKYIRTDEVSDDAPRGAFKACFRSMRLLKDGVPVAPIRPGRDCSWTAGVAEAPAGDAGCAGIYRYRPDDFDPDAVYTLEIVYEEQPDRPVKVRLDGDLIRRIHDDFVPYFESLHAQATP